MGQPAAFAPQGKTLSFTADVTSQSRRVLLSDLGLGVAPSCVRVWNTGTAAVWINFTASASTVVIPTPGTTTVGTPQVAFPLAPGVIEVISFPIPWTLLTLTPGNLANGFFMQDISTVAAQTYHVLFGEGV